MGAKPTSFDRPKPTCSAKLSGSLNTIGTGYQSIRNNSATDGPYSPMPKILAGCAVYVNSTKPPMSEYPTDINALLKAFIHKAGA